MAAMVSTVMRTWAAPRSATARGTFATTAQRNPGTGAYAASWSPPSPSFSVVPGRPARAAASRWSFAGQETTLPGVSPGCASTKPAPSTRQMAVWFDASNSSTKSWIWCRLNSATR